MILGGFIVFLFKNSEWLYLILFADDGSCHRENSDGRLPQNSRWLFPPVIKRIRVLSSRAVVMPSRG